MKVKMKTTACGPSGNLLSGHIYDLPDEQAQALFEGGYADIVPEPQKAAKSPAPVELAVKKQPETAQSPRGRRGRS